MNRYFKMSRYFTMMLGIFLAGACALQAQNVTPIVRRGKNKPITASRTII